MADTDEPASADEGGNKGAVKVGKKQVKNEHVLIIIGVVTLIITYVFLKRSASGNTASNTTTAAASPEEQAAGSYGGDYDQMADDLNAMQQEITGLQAQLPTASTTPVSTTTLAPGSTALATPAETDTGNPNIITQDLSTEVEQGAGFWGGSAAASAPVQTSTGQTFQYLPSWAQAQQDIQEDVPLFYQSSPGVFTSATTSGGQLAPALTQPGQAPTPLYVGNQ